MKLGLASNLHDEYQNIEGIWKIFGPVIDQWLVVDSGSMDNTPWKLQQIVGDKLKLIHSDMLKREGYGYARTKLIELSEGMDWVLTIDGDERMCPDDAKKLRHILEQDPPYDLIWLPRIGCHDREMRWIAYGGENDTPGSDKFRAIKHFPDWQARLIRRTMINGKSKVHFRRAVHEVPEYDTEIREMRDITGPIIEHFGRIKVLEKRQEVSKLCHDLANKKPEGLEEFKGVVYRA